jgi:formyl-CoA transferase
MLPFEQINIVDFSQRLPGPYCSGILADFGAEVTMVERAGSPPETRSVFPGLFELVNRNKRSMTLNMKNEQGQRIAEQLIKESDVLIEEFRPGVADRLGIGYEQVKKVNPLIIYCSISGFGQHGPYRDRVGHDINYLSLSGIMSIPGQPGIPPSRPGVPLVDLASGMYAAMSIMAALKRRDVENVGERIDVSMFDTMISWMGIRAGRSLIYGEPNQNEHLSALNNVYETKDGKMLSLGAIEPHFWKNFCTASGREDLLEDPKFGSPSKRKEYAEELLKTLTEIIAERSCEEWEKILDWNEVPYAPVSSIGEALDDPHVKARGLIQEVETSHLGNIKEIPFPVKFSGFDTDIRNPPPQWGEHTEEVLSDLGFTKEAITQLRKEKVV